MPNPPQAATRGVLIALVAGVALGGANSHSNVFGSRTATIPSRQTSACSRLKMLAAVLGTPWAWALTAFAVGWWSRNAWLGLFTGVIALVVAVVVDYGSDGVFGLDDPLPNNPLVGLWIRIALVAGSVFGLCGALGSGRTTWHVIPALAAPGVVFASVTGTTGSVQIQPWRTVVTWSTAVALLVFVVRRAWVHRQHAAR